VHRNLPAVVLSGVIDQHLQEAGCDAAAAPTRIGVHVHDVGFAAGGVFVGWGVVMKYQAAGGDDCGVGDGQEADEFVRGNRSRKIFGEGFAEDGVGIGCA
jgi:hypothetical protein